MGSCRMGLSAETSVVAEDGQAHAVENLYVADTSAFPTASGVNPMITCQGLAYVIAKGIAKRFASSSADSTPLAQQEPE